MAYAPVPGTNTSGSNIFPHLQPYFLRRTALDQLLPNTPFRSVCEEDIIDKRNGKTMTWYRWTTLPSKTTATAEGIVGTSSGMPPSKTLTVTAARYDDYITISDVLRDTASTSMLEAAARQLGIRGALTVDNLTRTIIDAETGAVGTLLGTYLKLADFKAQGHILEGRNVMPFDNSGYFEAITHPYTAFDIVNDPSANGLADTFKYTAPEKAGGVTQDVRGQTAVAGGCRIRKSTAVLQTSGTPNKWRTYIFGKGGVGATSISGYQPSDVKDPLKEDFTVYSETITKPSFANPTGSIGGFVSYKFMWAVAVLQGAAPMGGSYRYSMLDAPSSIVS